MTVNDTVALVSHGENSHLEDDKWVQKSDRMRNIGVILVYSEHTCLSLKTKGYDNGRLFRRWYDPATNKMRDTRQQILKLNQCSDVEKSVNCSNSAYWKNNLTLL